MPALHHHTHNRANMYGLARHARHYERWAGVFARPLYRRVVADVAAAGLPRRRNGARRRHRPRHAAAADRGPVPTAVGVRRRSLRGDDRPRHRRCRAPSESGCSPVSFQVADVADLPFDDRSVDLVVSTISMHHWADPAAGLREVVRVLRPGAQRVDLRLQADDTARGAHDVRRGRRGSPREPTHRDMAAQPDRSTRSPSRELMGEAT